MRRGGRGEGELGIWSLGGVIAAICWGLMDIWLSQAEEFLDFSGVSGIA